MRYDAIDEIAENVMARKTVAENDTLALFHHGLRVGRLSKNMASALGVSFRVQSLYIASLFHDCAVGLPVIESSWLAYESLKGTLDAGLLGEVCELIELKEAGKSDNLPDIIYILRDADTLDGVGTKAIFSHFAGCFVRDKGINDAMMYFEQGEFDKRMMKLRQTLYYELSKDIFDQRTDYCRDFAQRMRLEHDGNLV